MSVRGLFVCDGCEGEFPRVDVSQDPPGVLLPSPRFYPRSRGRMELCSGCAALVMITLSNRRAHSHSSAGSESERCGERCECGHGRSEGRP